MPAVDDALAALRDIHLPAEPGWWPPAPGWWLLTLIVLAVLTTLAHHTKKWRAKSLPRRRALHRLAELQSRSDQGCDPVSLIGDLSTLLRRTALARYPREDVAGLTGQNWLRFLDRSGDTDQFTVGPGECLMSAPYRQQDSIDTAGVLRLAESWIRRVS